MSFFGYFRLYIKSSEKFLSFYKEIMDAQYFPFYICREFFEDLNSRNNGIGTVNLHLELILE